MRPEQSQVVKCTEACSGGPGLCNSCRPAGPQCPLSLAVTVASQSVHHYTQWLWFLTAGKSYK